MFCYIRLAMNLSIGNSFWGSKLCNLIKSRRFVTGVNMMIIKKIYVYILLHEKLSNNQGPVRGKGGAQTQYEKSPYTDRKVQKATWQHKTATKNFDYTTIADRLWTVSRSDDSHPIDVVIPVYRIPTFPLTAKAV